MASIGAGHSSVDASTVDTKTPQEYITDGMWEVEPLYYSSHNDRPLLRGKAYRRVDSGDYVCFESADTQLYRIGDNVYLDSQQPELPFFICNITGFKMTKKEQLNAQVKWFYRPTEVPESVYHTLVQDRHTEHSHKESDSELCIKDPTIRCRELFISDAQDTYPISALRGHCWIKHYKDITEACEFVAILDTFFYILGYNPENNRLASIQGEIRIGPSHQAKLPAFGTKYTPEEAEAAESRVELAWNPWRIGDNDLLLFLKAVRSMAVFAGMRDGGSTEDGCLAASRDHTTINALQQLHQHHYVTSEALQKVVQHPVPVPADKKWSEEETKKFMKGLKQWGKNFFKIRKELLSHKNTSELVEFYYLWKKTPQAQGSQRPRPRQRRPQTQILRRVRPGNNNNKEKPSRPASSEFLDASSASENEADSEDSESKDLTGYACHHCYSTSSKNWHHAGKDHALLCFDCRFWFKKYGELRPVERAKTMPPCLFKPVKDMENDWNTSDVTSQITSRTRTRSCKDLTTYAKSRQTSPLMDEHTSEQHRKSPSAESTTSSGSSTAELTENVDTPKKNQSSPKKTPARGKRKGKRGGRSKVTGDREPMSKRQKNNSEEDSNEDVTHGSEGIVVQPATQQMPSTSDAMQTMHIKQVPLSPTHELDTFSTQETKENIIKKEPDAYDFCEEHEAPDMMSAISYKAQTQGSLLTPEKETPSCVVAAQPSSATQSTGSIDHNDCAPSTSTATSLLAPVPLSCNTSVIQVNQTQAPPAIHIKEEIVDEEGLVMNVGDPPAMKEPDPKIDDTILTQEHPNRSKFRRHWYRGKLSSCARTDLNWVREMKDERRRKREVTKAWLKANDPTTSNIKQEVNKTSEQPQPTNARPASHCQPAAASNNANGWNHPLQHPMSNHAMQMQMHNPFAPQNFPGAAAQIASQQQQQQQHGHAAAAHLRAIAEQRGPQQMAPHNQHNQAQLLNYAMREQMMLRSHLENNQMNDGDKMMLHEMMRDQQLNQQLRADTDLAAKMAQSAALSAQPSRPTPSAGQPMPPSHAPSVPPSRTPSAMPQPIQGHQGQVDIRAAQMAMEQMQQHLMMASMGNPNAQAQAQAMMEAAHWNRVAQQQQQQQQGQLPPGANEAAIADRMYFQRIMQLEQLAKCGDSAAQTELHNMLSLTATTPQHHTHSHTHTHLHLHGAPPVSVAPTTAPGGIGALFPQHHDPMASPQGVRFGGAALPTVNNHQELMRLSAMHQFGVQQHGGPAAEQLVMQMRHHEQLQQMALMRDRAQQQHNNDMMRRLQREGGVTGFPQGLRPPHPS